jgi:transposase
MDYFAGLDVSVKETSVCIVDDTGKIVREARVASEPEALLQVLTNTIYRFKRVGLEAGPLSQWLYSVLAEVHPRSCYVANVPLAVIRQMSGRSEDLSEPPDVLWSGERTRSEISGTPQTRIAHRDL